MRISLGQQIEEIESEIEKRRKVYKGLVYQRPSQASKLDYQMARMQAVLATLRWLAANESRIREDIRNSRPTGVP